MTHYGRAEIIRLYAESEGITTEDAQKVSFNYELTLGDGDTAYAPGTTKWDLAGPGKVMYLFWPEGGGDEAWPRDGVHRTYARKAV